MKPWLQYVLVFISGVAVWYFISKMIEPEPQPDPGYEHRVDSLNKLLSNERNQYMKLQTRLDSANIKLASMLSDTTKIHEKHKVVFTRDANLSADSALSEYERRYGLGKSIAQ